MRALVARIAAWLLRWRPNRKSPRARLGAHGETIAARFLRSQGYRIVERNVRVPMGEADIIALAPDGVTHVVVEVKTRTRHDGQHPRSAAADPEDSITATKRTTLRHILEHLRRANRWAHARIDVVAVEVLDGDAVIRHHIGAVDASATSRRSG